MFVRQSAREERLPVRVGGVPSRLVEPVSSEHLRLRAAGCCKLVMIATYVSRSSTMIERVERRRCGCACSRTKSDGFRRKGASRRRSRGPRCPGPPRAARWRDRAPPSPLASPEGMPPRDRNESTPARVRCPTAPPPARSGRHGGAPEGALAPAPAAVPPRSGRRAASSRGARRGRASAPGRPPGAR